MPGTDPDIPDKVGCRSVAPSEGTGNLLPASPSAMSDSLSPCPEESTQTTRVTHITVSRITKQARNRASRQKNKEFKSLKISTYRKFRNAVYEMSSSEVTKDRPAKRSVNWVKAEWSPLITVQRSTLSRKCSLMAIHQSVMTGGPATQE